MTEVKISINGGSLSQDFKDKPRKNKNHRQAVAVFSEGEVGSFSILKAKEKGGGEG